MKYTKHLLLVLCFGLLSSNASAQISNLIPNHSFEEFSGVPLGWFYNGNQFSKLVKYWYSPTLASPDVFGPDIIVPKHWQKKGFGNQSPKDGKVMAGITVFGCADGKPHCREYLQIQLNESLVVGQNYELTFSIAHLESTVKINKIGALLSMEALKQNDDGVIKKKPQFYSKEVFRHDSKEWLLVRNSFVADSAFNYITIGNFFEDQETKNDRSKSKFEFAYYYIDDVQLIKVPPIIIEEIAEDDLLRQPLEVGKTIQLKNIYFDTDKSDLLPRSFVELNKLRSILNENNTMRIEIHGHTDIQGESGYNKDLSLQRAEAVTQYLINSGIASGRIEFRGFGSELPIADNSDENGRKQNRRVEILITAL